MGFFLITLHVSFTICESELSFTKHTNNTNYLFIEKNSLEQFRASRLGLKWSIIDFDSL